MGYLRLFLVSMLTTAGVVLAIIFFHRPSASDLRLIPVGDNVYVSAQLLPDSFASLRKRGIESVVDFRPDGEEKSQPSSATMELAAKAHGMKFHYIPVPHEGIPDDAVNALTGVLSKESKPTALYCRTGRRAVKTFALSEASRIGGPTLDEILMMARRAQFSADDIRDDIVLRIGNRTPIEPIKN